MNTGGRRETKSCGAVSKKEGGREGGKDKRESDRRETKEGREGERDIDNNIGEHVSVTIIYMRIGGIM